jgi:hypothetical protein
MGDKILDRAKKECPFFTGVEYHGRYECGRYCSICYGCELTSDNWFTRTKAYVLLEIEMWYRLWLLYQVNRWKAYLSNKRDYYLFYTPYFWDKENRRKYLEGLRMQGKIKIPTI